MDETECFANPGIDSILHSSSKNIERVLKEFNNQKKSMY